MFEKYIFVELPAAEQIVLVRLNRYNGIELEAKFNAIGQEFLLLESGLSVAAIEVESWRNK